MKPKNIFYSFVLLVLPLFCLSQTGIINNGMNIIVEEDHSIILVGDMELISQNSGTIELDGMIQIESDITNNSTANTLFINNDNIGTLVFNGANEQFLKGVNTIAIDNLEVSSAGIQLNTNIEQFGELNFNSGRIYLNNYNYFFGETGIITGSFSADNMFTINGIGKVQKSFTSTGSFTFPIGDDSETVDYSPLVINISSISANTGGYISASVTDQKFYQNTSESEYLSRFWQLEGSDINNINFSASFYYTDDDVVGNENSIYSTVYLNGSIPFSIVNSNANSLTVNNQTDFAFYTGSNGITGINDLIADQFLVYPNPAHYSVNIEIPIDIYNDIKVELVNQQGIVVQNNILKSTEVPMSKLYKMNLFDISPGLYYIRLLTKENIILKKLIIN
jgi:Secretion system C-terminal sorting domain